jgi:hypothetical protein
MYVYCIEMCTYIQYIYTLQVCMSNSGVVMHYIEWSCQSPNSQEIHCFKWEFCIRFARRFEERNPGVKRELPLQYITVGLYIFCVSFPQ